MAETCATVETPPVLRLNVADRLHEIATQMPGALAVACPRDWSPAYKSTRLGTSDANYSTTTFAELDTDATRLACGLVAWGVPPGTRLALLVRPGIDFVALVFALLRAGMVTILVDPGLGKRNLMRCLAEAEPEGFVAISLAHAARLLLRRKFPRARWNVTVGRRWFSGGLTLDQLRAIGSAAGFASAVHDQAPAPSVAHGISSLTDSLPAGTPANRVGSLLPATFPGDPAAIIFTSGSTGPPKGVLYTHQMFDTQVAEIQSMYGIEPGGIDLACFPLFALFNSAMGVTTVLPEMDFSRPAKADPKKLLVAANDWQVTQAFASPAVWRVVGDYCAKNGDRIGSLQQVFSCGAPVPAQVLRKTQACIAPGARMHTPYGATECLPISTIEAAEVLVETASKTDRGAGVCVGRRFDSIVWRVIRITDEPIDAIEDAEELPVGETGELIVRGPQASPWYVTRIEANAISKIKDSRAEPRAPSPADGRAPVDLPGSVIAGGGDTPARFRTTRGSDFWHRTGDVGYLDDKGRFWYCGRKSQRVVARAGTLFTECVEAAFSNHPDIWRAALVGIGPHGDELPVIAIEFQPHVRITRYSGRQIFAAFEQLASRAVPATIQVDWLDFDDMLVDIRHNSKINREFLRRSTVMGILAKPSAFDEELVSRARLESQA